MSTHDEHCEQDYKLGSACRCYHRKLKTIQFGNVEPPNERLFEKQQEKDLPAYQRLRRNGLQPPTTRNAAELEARGGSQLEINMGKLIKPSLLRKHRNEIAEGMALARDGDYTVDDIKQWRDAAKAAG